MGEWRLERDDRVAEQADIRPGGFALDGVGGVRIAVIELCEEGGREMAAGGGPMTPICSG